MTRRRSRRPTLTPAKPVIIGHSIGGLLVQMLAGRGLAAATVAIDPGAFRGVLPLPYHLIRATEPVWHNPANHHRAVPLTFEQFRYGFANAVDEEQAKRLYETSAPSSTPRRARCLGGHSYGGCVITNASRRCRPAASRNCRARQADRGRPLRRHQSTYLPIIAST
jgi:hypothetical protein